MCRTILSNQEPTRLYIYISQYLQNAKVLQRSVGTDFYPAQRMPVIQKNVKPLFPIRTEKAVFLLLFNAMPQCLFE